MVNHPGCGWCLQDEATMAMGLQGEVGITPARDAPAIAGVPSLTELISDYRFLIHLSDWVAFHTFWRSTLS